MSSNSNSAKPKLACEIAADRVLVGRLGEDGRSLEASAARELAPGSVVPDLVEGNLRQRDAVRSAVEETLDSVAGRTHDVIAVVPDAAVRVVLLEFDTLPTNSEEAAGVVRFRLKKSLPFDVDKARVSYHAQKSKDGVRVVAAVALASGLVMTWIVTWVAVCVVACAVICWQPACSASNTTVRPPPVT